GAALALHGLHYRPNDLDIFADSADAARIADALRGVPVVFAFSHREADGLSSEWGRFLIDGVEVDIVGDFFLRGQGHAVTFDAAHPCWDRREWIAVGAMTMPVFSLQDLLEFYEALSGEDAKVELLRTALADGVSR